MLNETVQNVKDMPLLVNNDEATSKMNKRVLGVLVAYFPKKLGRVVVEQLTSIKVVHVTTEALYRALEKTV